MDISFYNRNDRIVHLPFSRYQRYKYNAYCSKDKRLSSIHLISETSWKSPVRVTPEAQVPLTLESKFRMTPIKS